MLENSGNLRTKKIKKIFKDLKKVKGRKPISALVSPNLSKIRKIPIENKPYTKKQLAEILDMEEKYYGNIERMAKDKEGKTYKLSFEKALLISSLYNVSLDYIYGFTRNKGEENLLSLLQDIIKFDTKESNIDITLKIDKNVINCLKDNFDLEKEYKGKTTQKEYMEYKNKKSQIESKFEDALKNSKKENSLGYYLINIEKYQDLKADNNFLEELKETYSE